MNLRKARVATELVRHRYSEIGLGMVLAFALGIRLWGIGAQSLWHDEVLTTISASVPFTQVAASVEQNENKPPLYFFVMNLWVRAAGLSEVALRLPSALFGAAAVGVIYLLGRDLLADRRAGLIAALLLAFSRYHIAYSQEARTYSLMFLLMLLACWFALRVTGRLSVFDQVGYVVSAALAMYAHPFAAFALAAINLFYVACFLIGPRPATDLRRWIILQLAFSLAFWPWLAKTWLVVKTGLPWIVESVSFPMAMLSYAGSPALIALLLALIGVALGYALIKRERGIVLLILLVLVPVFGPLAFSSRLYQTFIPRYGIIVVGAMALLAAYGAARLRPWATALVCLAYVAASLAHFRPGHGNFPGAEAKANIRAASRHVLANATAGDAVVNPSHALFSRPLTHYFRDSAIPVLGQIDSVDPRRTSNLWVFYSMPQGYEQPTAPAGYRAVERTDYDGVVLYRFAPAAEGPTTRTADGP